jgi:hypothetical protein
MSEQETEVDWKEIATQLARRVNFAINHLTSVGSGLVLNYQPEREFADTIHWRDYFADGMELIPGVKVDRDVLHCLNLPRNKRRKAIDNLKAMRQRATDAPKAGRQSNVEAK